MKIPVFLLAAFLVSCATVPSTITSKGDLEKIYRIEPVLRTTVSDEGKPWTEEKIYQFLAAENKKGTMNNYRLKQTVPADPADNEADYYLIYEGYDPQMDPVLCTVKNNKTSIVVTHAFLKSRSSGG